MTSRSKNSANDAKESKQEEELNNDSVNSGLQNFEQIRREWKTSSGKFASNPSVTQRGYNPYFQQQMQRYPPGSSADPAPAAVDPDEIIERLFSGSGNGALPESIPLGQMIKILSDVWETEGLYD